MRWDCLHEIILFFIKSNTVTGGVQLNDRGNIMNNFSFLIDDCLKPSLSLLT